MNIDKLNKLFLEVENKCPEIYEVKLKNISVWSVIKVPIFMVLLAKLSTNEESSFLSKFSSKSTAAKYIINSYNAKIRWFFFSLISKKSKQQKRILVALYGRRRLTIGELKNFEPFSDEIIINSGEKYETLSIESNKGEKPVKDVPVVPNYRENIFKAPTIRGVLYSLLISKDVEEKINLIKNVFDKYYKDDEEIKKMLGDVILSKVIKQKVLQFFQEYKSAELILKRMNLSSIVLVSPEGYYGLIAAAKKLNIPVIENQHGVIDKNHPQYNWPQFMKARKKELMIPDYLFVFGNYWQQVLLKGGFWNKNQLICTGNSGFEKQRVFFKNKVKKTKNATLLYTSAKPCRNEAIEFLNSFLNLIKENKSKVNLIIKLHPAENEEFDYYNALAIKYPDLCSVYYHKEKSLFDCFAISDLHLTVFSATALESISLGVPTGILNVSGKDMLSDVIEMDYLKMINDNNHLYTIVESINNNGENWLKWKAHVKNIESIFFNKFDISFVQKNLEKIINKA